VAFGCLPFAGFGSCTVNVTTQLPALRALRFAATTAQFFLEELATVIVTLALGETIEIPTRLASVLAVYEFFAVTVTRVTVIGCLKPIPLTGANTARV
jgi:hypothetical protein